MANQNEFESTLEKIVVEGVDDLFGIFTPSTSSGPSSTPSTTEGGGTESTNEQSGSQNQKQ